MLQILRTLNYQFQSELNIASQVTQVTPEVYTRKLKTRQFHFPVNRLIKKKKKKRSFNLKHNKEIRKNYSSLGHTEQMNFSSHKMSKERRLLCMWAAISRKSIKIILNLRHQSRCKQINSPFSSFIFKEETIPPPQLSLITKDVVYFDYRSLCHYNAEYRLRCVQLDIFSRKDNRIIY